MVHCSYCSAVALEFAMDDIVDRVLQTYELTRGLDAARVAESREKIIRYIDKLASAGHNDPHQLIVSASAYLQELHEGWDPRFPGCCSPQSSLQVRRRRKLLPDEA